MMFTNLFILGHLKKYAFHNSATSKFQRKFLNKHKDKATFLLINIFTPSFVSVPLKNKKRSVQSLNPLKSVNKIRGQNA